MLQDGKLEETFPSLTSFQLTYDIGYKKQIYDMIFPEQGTFPQITELIVNYPKEGTALIQWTNKLAKMFPNVKNKHLNIARQ